MSLDRILQTLEIEAEQQAAEIERTAQVEVERILNQAQTEAAGVRQKHLAASRSALQVERTRLLNRAKLEALQTVLKAREALLGSALETAAHYLAVLATSEVYPKLLRQLTEEAIDNLGADSPLCLHVWPRDVGLMQQIVGEMSLSASGVEDLVGGTCFDQTRFVVPELEGSGLGGLIVTTADGRVSLINTLEIRLKRVATLYRAQIAGVLFDPQQEG